MWKKGARVNNDTVKSQGAGQASEKKHTRRTIEVSAGDLPISCPMPNETLWNQHPRVFIPLKNGEGHCPYCGNHFRLKSS